MQYHSHLILLSGLGISLCASSLTAQNNSFIDNRSSEVSRSFSWNPFSRPAQDSLDQELQNEFFAPASPGDDDLGVQQILKEKEKIKSWQVFGEVAGYYTSNAALLSQNTLADSFLVTGFGVSYQKELPNSFIVSANARQQFFRYADYSSLDFDSFNIGTQLTYLFRDFHEIAVYSRYNYNLLTRPTWKDHFFDCHTLAFGTQKIFPVSKAQYWFTGGELAFNWADPTGYGRNEYNFFLGYNAQLTKALNANLYYRMGLFDYHSSSRTDVNNTVTLALSYTLFENCSITGSVSGIWNDSNRDVFAYNVFNPGGGLTLQYRF